MSRRLQRLIRRLFATGSLGTMLLAVVLLILGALTFFPVLALGPIADALLLAG